MPETFNPATWADGSGGGTPITAAQLNRIEAGIESMDDRVTVLEDKPGLTSASATSAESWTAADGSSWPAQWTVSGTVGFTANIQSNQGRLVTPATVSAQVAAVLSGGSVPNGQALAAWQVDSTGVERYTDLAFRYTDASNFYMLEFDHATARLWKRVAGTYTALNAGTSFVAAANTKYWARVQWIGSRIQARWWADGATEPDTWQFDVTDTAFTTGSVALQVANGSAPTSRVTTFDDFRMWNFGAGSGGSLTVQDEGSTLAQRSTLNFVGGGVSVADDAGNSRTTVTIPTGSSAVLGMVNVKADYGAVGNGTTDDSTAVRNAAAALVNGQVLYFPAGSYRIATSGTGIAINQKSNIGIFFAPGAELLMDNLSGGSGTGHGVSFVGTGDNIVLQNVRVRWATKPTNRSSGEAFRFLGYPSDSAPPGGWTGSTGKLSNIQLLNCTAINSPQTGAIFMGCSDIRVVGFRVDNTMADALHFNACRRANVVGHTTVDVGDDGLAFVTYFHATSVWQVANDGPFNQPSLGQWSNFDSAATNVNIRGGSANGCRIAGSYKVVLSNLTFDSVTTDGIIVDSAISNGTTILWSYHASRQIAISNVQISNTPIGIRVPCQNVGFTDSSAFWQFDVAFDNILLQGCSNWSIRCEGNGSGGTNSGFAGLSFNNVRCISGSGGGGNGSIAFAGVKESSITNLYMETTNAAAIFFFGQESTFSAATSTLPINNVVIDNVRIKGGTLLVQELNGALIGSLESRNAPADGVMFIRCRNLDINKVRVYMANRNNTGTVRLVFFQKVTNTMVSQIHVDHDANNQSFVPSLGIDGGDATERAANGLRIERFTHVNTINSSTSNIIVQSDANGPLNYYIKGAYYNGGEASPIWRSCSQSFGSTTSNTLPDYP